MAGLVDRSGDRPGEIRPPVVVVRRRGALYLRPLGPDSPAKRAAAAARPGADRLRACLAGMALLAGTMVASLAFTGAFRAATRNLAEGSLAATSSNGARALVRERDRREELLADYDRLIAGAAGDPAVQSAWRDLRRHEAETVARLTRHLNTIRRRPSAMLEGGP